MQCLFCGKELALLKRLRGGGEFCSEAHRKDYQEQYEQLALARLLQAKPPAEAPLLGKVPLVRAAAELTNAPDPRLAAPYQRESPYEETQAPAWSEHQPDNQPEHQPGHQPDYQIDSPSPVAILEAPASEESGPAPLAGFVSEPVVPAVTPFNQAGLLELDSEWERVDTPPSLSAVTAFTGSEASESSQRCLPPAPRVELALSLQALEHHTRTSDRGLELREFTGPAPIIELHLRPETGTEPAGADDVMEILMSPHPPQKAKLWLGVPRVFPAVPAELGDLARLDFATNGFAYSDGPPQAAALAPELPQAPPQVFPDAPQQIYAEPAPEAFIASAGPMAPAEPLAAEPAPPELVTRALPVTLHGLSAARGKLAPAFPSAIAAASDVQIPPSAALPLRPAIVFGPSPAPVRAPQAAASPAESKQVQPGPAQSLPVQSLPSQPQPVQSAPAQPKPAERRTSVVPAPKPVPVRRQAAAETPIQEKVQEKVQDKVQEKAPERAQEKTAPRPSAPASPAVSKPWESAPASETTIPSLRLEATEGAWSKLSTNVKIGVAAALVVGLSGIAFLVTRGSGKTTVEAPVAVAAPTAVASGVAISGGWIDDWANSAKSRRHISVLSGSVKLSDYRLEFQSQIETKAIGWIFRGLNPRNYYVTKLEIVTPGLEPTIALVHFAVVDGEDENRVVVPLPMKVRVDTTYKIRFEAMGNHFTTWVQDQKIAEWTDSRFGSGGVGFFSDRDEKAAVQGPVNVVPLVPKN